MAQEVVADVSQVQGFVGIGRRVLYEYWGLISNRGLAIMVIVEIVSEKVGPERLFDGDVQISFYHVESRDDVHRLAELFANLVGDHVGCFAGEFDVGEDHDGAVALELFAGGLDEFGVSLYVNLVEGFQCVLEGGGQDAF